MEWSLLKAVGLNVLMQAFHISLFGTNLAVNYRFPLCIRPWMCSLPQGSQQGKQSLVHYEHSVQSWNSVAIAASNGSDGEWAGLFTRHVAAPAILTGLPPHVATLLLVTMH